MFKINKGWSKKRIWFFSKILLISLKIKRIFAFKSEAAEKWYFFFSVVDRFSENDSIIG